MNKVVVEVMGLSSSPSSGGAYALLLKESYGVRRLPIIIGAFEAQAIAIELEGIKSPRPLTHDLMKSIIDILGAQVSQIVITELRDNTFFARIMLEFSSMTDEIDARPSDAIALALRTEAPIYVSEEVMRTAAFSPNQEESTQELNMDEENEDQAESQPDILNDKESRLTALQEELKDAINKEDYEKAAKLRDEISKIGKKN